MDSRRRTHAADHDSLTQRPAPRALRPEGVLVNETAASVLQRLITGPFGTLTPGAILGMQRAVGNRAVQRFFEPRIRRQPSPSVAAGSFAKTLGQEDELARKSIEPVDPLPAFTKKLGQEEEFAKAIRRAPAPDVSRVAGSDVAVAVELMEPNGAHDLALGHQHAHGPFAKVSSSVKSGAAATNALGAGVYGLTFPERVDVTISAKLDKTAGTWSPKVKKLVGHYSMQTRLLPGQAEITGPGGNTSQANFCDQATNLASIGNTPGNLWYMISAVVKHEKVHASRFGDGLKDMVPTITAAIEAVTVPHVGKMNEKQAIAQIKADPTYQTEVTNALGHFIAGCAARIANDHAAGGPTDKAEQKVTEPMRKKICSHAKKKTWGACAACP